MRRVPLVLLALSLPASAAHAATFTAGTNFGFMVQHSEGSSSFDVAIPSGNVLFGEIEPGLRLGIIGSNGGEEGFLNTGFTLLSGSGETFYALVNTLNYQHNFSPGGVSPYVTAGLGFVTIGDTGNNETNLIVGGALGVRTKVADGHGAFRSELRIDHLNESDARRSFDSVGLQLGFDLWIGR